MSWQDRLNPNIRLTSPKGTVFVAYWRGDTREFEKKLGVFEFPGVIGAEVQDLDVGANRQPLTIFFEGSDCDLESSRFFEACSERGSWEVVHPVKGVLFLQFATGKEHIKPVESGNVYRIDLECIEISARRPFKLRPTVSAPSSLPQYVEAIRKQAEVVDAANLEQLEKVVKIDTPSKLTAFKNSVSEALTRIDVARSWLRQQEATAVAAFESVQRGIDLTAAEVVSIGSQIQTLVNLPSQMATDLKSRFDFYRNLILNTVSDLKTDSVNKLAVSELVLVTAFKSLGSVMREAEFLSRSAALEKLEDLTELYNIFNSALEVGQTDRANDALGEQYFNQLEVFNEVLIFLVLVKGYLLQSLFDLAFEKRFTLTKIRTPVELAISEYGGTEKIDFFIKSNGLSGQDILFLPAGREVVVFL